VRALTRRPEAAGLPAAVDVVAGDFTVPESLDAALQGVAAVFLLWTAPPGTAPAVIERLASHTRRVVFLSAPYKTPHPFFQQPNPMARFHAEVERLIAVAGLEATFVRPGLFASNALFWWVPAIKNGDVVRWPYGAAETAPIDERRAVRFEELSPGEFRRETAGVWPGPIVDMLLAAWGATMGQRAFVTSTVADVTGSPARTFRQWVVDHADAFRGAVDAG